MGIGRWTVAALAAGFLFAACTGDTPSKNEPGSTSGGTGAGSSAGSGGTGGTGSTGVSGATIAGSVGTTTGSVGSGGTTGQPAQTYHASAQPGPATGWQLLNAGNGAPSRARDVSADAAGNLWVAGDTEGLFLLPAGGTAFRHFGLGDGLHPYGFPQSGTITQVKLKVLSVAGGAAGNVYVGYEGVEGCEDEWDLHASNPDPNIYKSGDADHVWLSGQGISVAHYDIYTGAGVVADETRGREKLCSIYRIAYDGAHGNVWIGANHGYAWLNPEYSGSPAYDGKDEPSILQEHAHPAISGYPRDDSPATDDFLLTGGYYGLALQPNGDVWVGGIFRSYHCAGGNNGANFWGCEADDNALANHQIDIWPDPVKADAKPHQRVDDYVSGLAVMADGTVWASARNQQDDPSIAQSMGVGLAHLGPDGAVLGYLTDAMLSPHLTAVAADPLNGSLWVGSDAGLMRYDPSAGVVYQFGSDALGGAALDPVNNIQVDTSGGKRRILVAFDSGTIAIYSGD